ncbi:hypothetical protein Cgig2_024916 [Carnegiea gigantea]|uniref:Uncharacterized protein n=1 Tax=Carnegiea gigantea TaxID=171969 RepID=A0A9Q1KDC4_9CARY|nr:hypothetical protein Cgig2_024916 [Carnegiea gigantea]
MHSDGFNLNGPLLEGVMYMLQLELGKINVRPGYDASSIGIDANVQGRIVHNYFQLVTNGAFTCSDHTFVHLNIEPAHQPRRGTNFKYQRLNTKKHILLLRKIEKWGFEELLCIESQVLDKTTYGNFKHKLERNADILFYIEEKLVQSPNSARLNNCHYRLIE